MSNTSLKLISLNIWGGHLEAPLIQFIKDHADVDILCLQEVYSKAKKHVCRLDMHLHLDIFSDFQSLLPNHSGFFRPVVNDSYGIGIFVKKSLNVLHEGEVGIHTNSHYEGLGPTHSRILQFITLEHNHQPFTVVNVHGLWNGQGKTDSPERLVQSKKIKEFLDSTHTPVILCGDFNLRPDTQSLKMLEPGMKNHITLSGTTNTRTSYYPGTERFADYILTSESIPVKNFQVLPHEVSDHAPLLLEFF